MAEVILKNVRKVYPNTESKKKKKKDEAVEKKNNLEITDEGVVAVQDFNIDVADKEFIVLVGPSGCGKSTTLRMIAGLEEISGGELFIDGKQMNDVAPKDRDIAMVFQNYALYPHMTVYENIAFPLKLKKIAETDADGKTHLKKMPNDEIDRRVREAAAFVSITEDLLQKSPFELSGGQKRRMQLMLILLDAPNVLILDEPSNDMDIDMLVAMENLLDSWPGTLIMVTHDRYMMERVTDHQFALIDGTLRHVPRGAEEYLEQLEAARAKRGRKCFGVSEDATPTVEGEVQAESAQVSAVPKLSGGELREVRKRVNSLERRMQTLEGKIAQAQDEQAQADPSDYVALGEIQERITQLQKDLGDLEEEWLEASELL